MISKALKNLLNQRPRYCAVVNRFSEPEASAYLSSLGCTLVSGLPLTCFTMESPKMALPPSPQTKDNLLYYYLMDIASLFPVLGLRPTPLSSVLDMCAAPGGKAFALMQILAVQRSRQGASLALNDSSQTRLNRLKDVVLSKCLPRGQTHSVRFTKRRAEEWGSIEANEYDCVLVDAPCSSDRHHSEDWLRKDKPYPRTKSFSSLQAKLLLAGLLAARPGGSVVYSTCTLSSMENDGVVRTVLDIAKNFGLTPTPVLDQSVYQPLKHICTCVTTEYGLLVTPSAHSNCGPMFVCQLCV